MFKFTLHEKTAKHIRQLTEPQLRKANIRAMLAFLNFCNAGRRIAVWVRSSNANQLKNMNTADIVEIAIGDPTKYYSITKHEDIQTLFNVLQSMNLSRKFNSYKDGFAFYIDIKVKSGEKIYMSFCQKM